ncbi:MAG: hypothetical protein ACKPKO_37025 [Candidatus Fonsibacter sp.]
MLEFIRRKNFLINLMYQKWTDQSYKVEDITISHGITFYKTTAREIPFLRHDILKSNS